MRTSFIVREAPKLNQLDERGALVDGRLPAAFEESGVLEPPAMDEDDDGEVGGGDNDGIGDFSGG